MSDYCRKSTLYLVLSPFTMFSLVSLVAYRASDRAHHVLVTSHH